MKMHSKATGALLTALALCVVVMYITTDGDEPDQQLNASFDGDLTAAAAGEHVKLGFMKKIKNKLKNIVLKKKKKWNGKLVGKKWSKVLPKNLQPVPGRFPRAQAPIKAENPPLASLFKEGGAINAQSLSVHGTDIGKFHKMYTTTPDGRVRLLNYFKKIEHLIAKEASERKRDIESVEAQMAKNAAYNARARKQMKAMLLKKMAENAKEAKKKLEAAQHLTAQKFAAAAALANKRNAANIARSAKTREIMRKNKREGAKHLAHAVKTMQRSLAAVSQATNERIKQTNKHIAANAVLMKKNAKIAQQNLQKAMHRFNNKMDHANAVAKAGRSKLTALAKSLTKKTRAMVQNKITALATSTAARFAKVRTKMAKDRHNADMNLVHATKRLQSSLNANKALMDKRFASTVKDIAAAKAEAKARINKAKAEFKVGLLHLGSVVKHQVGKLNNRVTQLAGVVQNNKLAQDKVNRNIEAERKRMVKLGNAHYNTIMKKDKALGNLMAKNQREAKAAMDKMANSFNAQMGSIRRQMKKDRAHATHQLASKTAALYDTLKKQAAKQMDASKKLAAYTARTQANLMAKARELKASFTRKLAVLHTTVTRNDKKQNAAIEKLTGVVQKNAEKSAAGRKLLKFQMNANKLELKAAIRDATAKGEQRALRLMHKMKDVNKKAIAALNSRVTVQISHLAGQTAKAIGDLRAESKAARAALKKELTLSIKAAADDAKKAVAQSVKGAQAKFLATQRMRARASKSNAVARALLVNKVKANEKAAQKAIEDAVSEQTRTLLALKAETSKRIKKSNKNVAAAASQMIKNAAAISAKMKANVASLNAKISAAKAKIRIGIGKAEAASAQRHAAALFAIKSAVKKAQKVEDAKFKNIYAKMAANRKRVDQKLAGMSSQMNDKLAKMQALQDSRFKKTVKDIAAAKAAAAAEVKAARQQFTTALIGANSAIKQQETRLAGEVAVVSAEVASNKQQQAQINRRAKAEMKRITNLMNKRASESKRARGKLRAVMNKNKRIAASETAALAKRTTADLLKIRRKAARWRRDSAIALTKRTTKFYGVLANARLKQNKINAKLSAANRKSAADVAKSLKGAKADMARGIRTLTNTVTANNKKYEAGMKRLSGVAQNFRKVSKASMKTLRTQRAAMNADLNKAIVRSIQLGTARAKATVETQTKALKKSQQGLMNTVATKCQRAAENAFAVINENRAQLADNFLSVKAYASAAQGSLQAYVTKGKGRGLSSLGDFLLTVARADSVRTKAQEGVGAGMKRLMPLFGGKKVKVKNSLSKINGLTNEYVKLLTSVKQRWMWGIGKYLLTRLAASMEKKGILQVSQLRDKRGTFVFVNGHTVGLSNKLKSFTKLAMPMKAYKRALHNLTKKIVKGKAKKRIPKKPFRASPPEYQGH